MRTSNKPYLIAVLLLFFTSEIFGQSQKFGSVTYNTAVNISGRQRMLTQKMAKAFLLLSYGVNNKDVKKELTSSKYVFQRQLNIIKENGETEPAVKLLVKNAERIWIRFKALIEGDANLDTAKQVLDLNTDLLMACSAVVIQIESISGYSNQFFNNYDQELVTFISKSSKQRMLSQRLGLYYAACKLFPNNQLVYREVLRETFNEFNEATGHLLVNNYNTSESEEEIEGVMQMWRKYSNNRSDFLDANFDLVDVFKTTNRLTAKFSKVTGIYEAVAKNKI